MALVERDLYAEQLQQLHRKLRRVYKYNLNSIFFLFESKLLFTF